MDVSTAMTPTQLLLIWTLTSLLFAWMILFTLLALRPDRKKKIDFEDPGAADGSSPKLHVVVHQQAEARIMHMEESGLQQVQTASTTRGLRGTARV